MKINNDTFGIEIPTKSTKNKEQFPDIYKTHFQIKTTFFSFSLSRSRPVFFFSFFHLIVISVTSNLESSHHFIIKLKSNNININIDTEAFAHSIVLTAQIADSNNNNHKIRSTNNIMSIAKRDDEPASSAMNISSDPKAKHTKRSVDKAKKTNKIKAANASYCTREEITVHDIISGRGASINQHPGNEYYRQLIKSQKLKYINSAPPAKKGIIRAIVIAVTKLQSPPGRFLKYNEENGVYEDIGILEAKKKTGQALREDAAKIRQMNAAISDFLNSSREVRAAAGARNGEEKSIVGVVQKAAVESAFNLVQRKQHQSPKTPNHHNRSDIKRANRYMTTFDDMECAVDEINRCKERIQAIAIRQNRAANPPEDRHSLSPILRPFTEAHIYNQVYTGNYGANANARSMQVPASNLARSPMPPLFEATSRATSNVYIPQTDGGTGGAIHGNPEYYVIDPFYGLE